MKRKKSQLPIDIFFKIKESKQNSVHSKTSCCFEPMVNTKQHSNNEEYYNFDHDENKSQKQAISIPTIQIYMIVHIPGLVQAFN
jgi:hypothetical protein